MQSRLVHALLRVLCLATLAASTLSFAQEGHPLKGSWIGEWQGNQAHGANVLVVLDWDGEHITGIINPGTHNIPITNATLDPESWTVRIEADASAPSGSAVRYVIEGTIEDLALPNRYITGTWSSRNERGAFLVRRQ